MRKDLMRKHYSYRLAAGLMAGVIAASGMTGITVYADDFQDETAVTSRDTGLPIDTDQPVDKAVVMVNGMEYKSINEALAKVPKNQQFTSVSLLSDVNTTLTVDAGQNILLDLNGHTINTGDERAILVSCGGKLSIYDGSQDQLGAIYSNCNSAIKNCGSLIVNDVKIKGSVYSIFTSNPTSQPDAKPSTAIYSGTLNGIGTNGSESNTEIYIRGGTFTSLSYLAAGNSTYFIRGGTFDVIPDDENNACVELRAGTLTINGGDFTWNGDTSTNATNTPTPSGESGGYKGAIVVCKPNNSSQTAYSGDAQLIIGDGTFSNSQGDAIVVADHGSDSKDAGHAVVQMADGDVTGDVKFFQTEDRGSKLEIAGGSFVGASDLQQFTEPKNSVQPIAVADGITYVGSDRVTAALKNAGKGTSFVVTQGNVDVTEVRAGVSVKNVGTGTVLVNSNKVTDKEYIVPNHSSNSNTNTKPNKPSKPNVNSSVTMFRLYNPNSGEHFYTKEASEKSHLISVGWKDEGTGWTAPKESKTPVYRLYNPNAGDHHYTMNKQEKDMLVSVGWKYEGIGWYSDDAKSVPLYRQYNPNAVSGAHNYTTSKAENDYLTSMGWNAEGIAWYGVK